MAWSSICRFLQVLHYNADHNAHQNSNTNKQCQQCGIQRPHFFPYAVWHITNQMIVASHFRIGSVVFNVTSLLTNFMISKDENQRKKYWQNISSLSPWDTIILKLAHEKTAIIQRIKWNVMWHHVKTCSTSPTVYTYT